MKRLTLRKRSQYFTLLLKLPIHRTNQTVIETSFHLCICTFKVPSVRISLSPNHGLSVVCCLSSFFLISKCIFLGSESVFSVPG